MMCPSAIPVVRLSEMTPGAEGDLFVLMTLKESLTTRDGKPYFRVAFRDARREVAFPIWANSPLAADCRDQWSPGRFYKLRAVYRETPFGPQLEIRKIREAVDADAADGFDPTLCRPASRFNSEEMFDELLALATAGIPQGGLQQLVLLLLERNRSSWLSSYAARRHHHAFAGGLLEHTLGVARNSAFLADRYARLYPEMRPPLDRGLVVAGAILHDIGKLEELASGPTGAQYTPAGQLIGHLLQGRDMVRQAAAEVNLEPDTLLRLEHIIIAHQRLPEWGSPKPPMTPEALLVHYADDVDAKFHQLAVAITEEKPFHRLMGQR